ncbi:MAG: hypothetical protein IJN57_02815 [Oscillospiraceae bacterium]|nr:hypothetical protein [Oscillospiraceae bacterium]
MQIEIEPLKKVTLDGIDIYLSMERAAVASRLGGGDAAAHRCYYYDNELAIDYDEDGKVEFIEFLGGADGRLKPFIYGVSVFDTDADDLYAILQQQNQGGIDDSEGGYSYAFLNLSVGIYREATPEDAAEMIEEAKREGCPLSDEEIADEMKRAHRWATIGIGTAGYYQR